MILTKITNTDEIKKAKRQRRKIEIPDPISETMDAVNNLSDAMIDSRLAGDFRLFLTSDKVMGFAVGVVVGNAFSDFVKTFVDLSSGVVQFIYVWLVKGIVNGSVIPWSNFIKSFFTMILIAVSVFVLVKLLNLMLVRNPKERFGYNASLAETMEIKKGQQETNKLLRELIELNKSQQNDTKML